MSSIEMLLAIPVAIAYEGEEVEAVESESSAPAPDVSEATEARRNKVRFEKEQQAYVNALLAEERRKAQQKNDALITELETQKTRVSTTAAERKQLEQRIEDLRAEYATKEEMEKQSVSKQLKSLDEKLKAREAEAAAWKARFEQNKRRVDLTQAAVSNGAFNPNQVVTLLEGNTRLIDAIDPETGKPTGEFETRVRIQVKDDAGKVVPLDLTPADAVAKIKEQADLYGNLFIAPGTGGLGGSNLGRGGHKRGLAELSTAEFMEQRRAERAKSGRRPYTG